MVVFIRSNDANPDPRLQKYINFTEDNRIAYKVIAWNRSGSNLEKENYIYFNKKAKFGMGVRNIPNKLMWFLFIIITLIKLKKEFKTIHACDLDTAIPAYLIKTLFNKQLIFDVFDWNSDENSTGILRKLVSFLENGIFKSADHTIICEEHRINQVKKTARREFEVLPNIPDIHFTINNEVKEEILQQRKQYNLILSYVGVFDRNRGLEDLLNSVSKNPNIYLNIAGFGNLDSLVEQYDKDFSNIRYWGKVEYNYGLNIMKHSDLIVAFYYLASPVHFYAAPNKYYEGLLLGKPLLTNNGTIIAEKIKSYNTGFVINEGEQEITRFLNSNDYKEMNVLKKENSLKMWREVYKDYTVNFMVKKYRKILGR